MGKAQTLTLCQKCNVSSGPGVPCKCIVKVSAPDQAPFVRDMLANMLRAGGDPLQRPGNRLSLKAHGAGDNTMLDDTEALAKYCLLTRQYLDSVCGLNVPRIEKLVPKSYAPDALRDELDALQLRLRELAWPKPKIAEQKVCPKCKCTIVLSVCECQFAEARAHHAKQVEYSREYLSVGPAEELINKLLTVRKHKRFTHVRLVAMLGKSTARSGSSNAYAIGGGDPRVASVIASELERGVRYALFSGPENQPLTLQWCGTDPLPPKAIERLRAEANVNRVRNDHPVCYVEDLL